VGVRAAAVTRAEAGTVGAATAVVRAAAAMAVGKGGVARVEVMVEVMVVVGLVVEATVGAALVEAGAAERAVVVMVEVARAQEALGWVVVVVMAPAMAVAETVGAATVEVRAAARAAVEMVGVAMAVAALAAARAVAERVL